MRARLARAQPWLVVSLCACFAPLVIHCGAAQKPERQAWLRVESKPELARVTVDNVFFGSTKTLRRFPRSLPVGKHLLTVEADGYFPHDMELQLPAGQTRLRIELRPVPR